MRLKASTHARCCSFCAMIPLPYSFLQLVSFTLTILFKIYFVFSWSFFKLALLLACLILASSSMSERNDCSIVR